MEGAHNCAGCHQLLRQPTHTHPPSFLEPVVYANEYEPTLEAYECLACGERWTHDRRSGHWMLRYGLSMAA